MALSNSKDSKIKLNAIRRCISMLGEFGLSLQGPQLKYLGNGLYELRPIRDRIIFVAYTDSGFMLLHHFMKETQKTPKKELEIALANLKLLKERGGM